MPNKRNLLSPLRYVGGKSKVTDSLLERFPKERLHYIEPFFGGGSVGLLAKQRNLFESYWFNDLFPPLYNFWIELMTNPDEFIRELDHIFSGIKDIEDFRDLYPEIKRRSDTNAVDFFILNRISFGGSTQSGGFSPSAAKGRFNPKTLRSRLENCSELLKGCSLSSEDANCLIGVVNKFENKDYFMFLDPPYIEASNLYGKNGSMHKFDHNNMAELLKETKFKWLMTLDDCKETRRLYEGWAKIEQFDITYSLKKRKTQEVMIGNYDF